MNNDPKYYINDKTNSIIKNSVIRNNRDVVATIVFNELTDLLNYNNISEVTTQVEEDILNSNINRIHKQLYSTVPLKLEKYCEKCSDCCCCCDNNSSLLDCFVLGLLLEDGTPWLQEQTNDGIFLLEKQRESICFGDELVCKCCEHCQCECDYVDCMCISTLQLESIMGSFLWDCDTPILLESQELCDGVCCDCKWTKDPEKEEEKEPEWIQNTSDLLKGCLDVFKDVYRPDLYDKDDLKCDCACCKGSYCSLCK